MNPITHIALCSYFGNKEMDFFIETHLLKETPLLYFNFLFLNNIDIKVNTKIRTKCHVGDGVRGKKIPTCAKFCVN